MKLIFEKQDLEWSTIHCLKLNLSSSDYLISWFAFNLFKVEWTLKQKNLLYITFYGNSFLRTTSWLEVDGAGWRLEWTGWRWIKLGAQFNNTILKFCYKAIISWRFINFRILWFHLNLMVSSKEISASQRLKCSLDIFFMLGILLRNSSTLKKVLEPFQPSSSCLMLAQSLAPFPCLFSYW